MVDRIERLAEQVGQDSVVKSDQRQPVVHGDRGQRSFGVELPKNRRGRRVLRQGDQRYRQRGTQLHVSPFLSSGRSASISASEQQPQALPQQDIERFALPDRQ